MHVHSGVDSLTSLKKIGVEALVRSRKCQFLRLNGLVRQITNQQAELSTLQFYDFFLIQIFLD